MLPGDDLHDCPPHILFLEREAINMDSEAQWNGTTKGNYEKAQIQKAQVESD